MQIWTTPDLNNLLSIVELPLRLMPERELKAAFLAQAAPEDVAIIMIDEGYLEFLSEARKRGITGPLLLISPEPTMIEADLQQYHAFVMDLKKMGSAVVGNFVHFVLYLARHYYLSRALEPVLDVRPTVRTEDRALEDPRAILERLRYVQRKENPVLAGLEIREHGEPVNARGSCYLKSADEDALVLHRFKQPLLFRAMKKGLSFRVYFSYKQVDHVANLVVRHITDKEVSTSLPDRLFLTRDIRIQPNPTKPVILYLLIPREPTTSLKVVDISPRGIGFLCDRDLPADGVFGFTVMLPDPQAVVLTSGIIRYKKESDFGIRYGAEIQPHPWDEESIAKYILKRDAEIISLLRSI